jgi:hypothetical protein
MPILYKIFSFIISLFAFFIAMALLILIPVSLAMPPLWFPVFLFVAIVLYTWFSIKMQRLVFIRGEVVKASLKDWVKVNGYVAIVFSILNITPMLALLKNPDAYLASMRETMKQLGPQYQQNFTTQTATTLAIVMIIYLTVLFAHVLWTFTLIKKHEEHFQ